MSGMTPQEIVSELDRHIVGQKEAKRAPNWAATDGVVTVHAPGQPPVEVCLTEGGNKLGMCAVATLENRGGQLNITRDVRYFAGHRDVDAAFGWGLRWSAGSKD